MVFIYFIANKIYLRYFWDFYLYYPKYKKTKRSKYKIKNEY